MKIQGGTLMSEEATKLPLPLPGNSYTSELPTLKTPGTETPLTLKVSIKNDT